MSKIPIYINIPSGIPAWEADNWRKVAQGLKDATGVETAVYHPSTGLSAVGKVTISQYDTTPNYLQLKLISGTGVTLTKGETGGVGSEILTAALGPLTADWDAGSFSITALRFISDQATGTAPFTITSTTMCANLNADLLDGSHAAAFEPALGNPGVNGYVLSSTTAGVRSWVVQSGGSSFTTNSKASMSADQTITDKTWTKVNFDTDVIDTDNELNNANYTWVCTTTGTYIVSGVISWTANDQGLRAIGISEDGSAPGVTSYISTVQNAGALATTRTFIFGTISCTAAQAISIWGYHSKGTSLDIDADGSYFAVFRIA